MHNLRRGFTLVELIVVIAIFGLLAAAVLIAINPVKQLQKARDTQKIAAAQEIQKAISHYILTTGKPPANLNPSAATCSTNPNFLQELVNSGELKQVPKPPSGTQYCYYDYGAGNAYGAIVVVNPLEAIPATTVAPEGSCRPFGANNWCSSVNPSKYYCLCTPY